MASNASKSSKSVKLLVANKKVMETEKGWNKLEYPVLKGADGVYFIDDADGFTEIVSKMGSICKKPISRMYYIDSDNDEVPIDSEVELKEALKIIGERTDKGKFTTMKIETDFARSAKKKEKTKTPKKVLDKVTTKPKESAPRRPAPNLVAPLREILREELKTKNFKAEVAKLKTELSQAWLEKHLHRIKLEIMADLETILEPYIKEQKKMSALIATLRLEDRAVPPVNMKKHPESDHNYSASSNSKKSQEKKTSEKKCNDSEEAGAQIYENIPLKDDSEGELIEEPYEHCLLHGVNTSNEVCTCQYFDENDEDGDNNDIFDDDDNLSILSGEISVTDSESDVEGGVDDFVDVPLPSCFNVVAPEEGNVLSKSEKEGKSLKANQKGRYIKSTKSETSAKNKIEERKSKSKTNTDQNASANKKSDTKKESRRKGNLKQDPSNSSPAMEKPQPQVSAAVAERSQSHVSAAVSPLTNARAVYASQSLPYGYYAYPYVACMPNEPLQAASEVVGSQDPSASYRMHPVAATACESNYPLIWGQNATSYISAQASQQQQPPQAQVQPQVQVPIPPQIPPQMQPQAQSQMQSQMPRQMQQPLQPTQLQQSIHALLQHAHARLQRAQGMQAQGMQAQGLQAQGMQAQGMQAQGMQAQGMQAQSVQAPLPLQVDASGRQMVDNRIETTYNGMPLHEYPVNASEAHNNPGMPIYYANPKPGPGAGGLYGGLKN